MKVGMRVVLTGEERDAFVQKLGSRQPVSPSEGDGLLIEVVPSELCHEASSRG